jgi:hypothetical protein
MALKENAPTQVGAGPPAALPLIGGKAAPCPSKSLLEQFRLGHARSLLALSQKAIIAVRDAYSYPPPAVTTITSALRANHSYHHATTYRQAAFSLGLVQVGVTTDTPAIAWAMGTLMGVALSIPAEMKNQFLDFAAPF